MKREEEKRKSRSGMGGGPDLPNGLYRRKDSKIIWMSLPNRQCKSTGTTNVARAKALRDAVVKQIVAKQLEGQKTALTLAQVAKKLDEERRSQGIRNNLKGGWWGAYMRYIDPHLGSKPFHRLTATDISDWVSQTLNHAVSTKDGSPLSLEYRGIIFRVLRMVYEFGYEKRWHAGMRFPRTRLVSGERNKHQEKSEMTFRLWEVASLLVSPEVPMDRRTLYATAFFCGLRASETTGIEFGDVDWSQGVLRLRRQADGKPLKTGKRTITLHGFIYVLMQWWRDHGFHEVYGYTPEEAMRMFPPTNAVSRRLPYRAYEVVRRALVADVRACGFRAGLTPHMFRSGFISAGMEAGADKAIVKGMTHPKLSAGSAHERYERPSVASRREELLKIEFPPIEWFPWHCGSTQYLDAVIDWIRIAKHRVEERGEFRPAWLPELGEQDLAAVDEREREEEARFAEIREKWMAEFAGSYVDSGSEEFSFTDDELSLEGAFEDPDAPDIDIANELAPAPIAGGSELEDDNNPRNVEDPRRIDVHKDGASEPAKDEGSEPLPTVAAAPAPEVESNAQPDWEQISFSGEQILASDSEAVVNGKVSGSASTAEVAEAEPMAEPDAARPEPVAAPLQSSPRKAVLMALSKILGLPVEILEMMNPGELTELTRSIKRGSATTES